MLDKIIELKNRIMIPKQVNKIFHGLKQIEELSLGELQSYVTEVSILQDVVMKNKDKLRSDNRMNYTSLIVDLCCYLNVLYEDKIKEQELKQILEDNNNNLFLQIKEELEAEIGEEIENIRIINSRYEKLLKHNKKNRINFKKYFNRIKRIELRKKYVTVPTVKVKLIKNDCDFKYYLRYQKRRISKKISQFTSELEKYNIKLRNNIENKIRKTQNKIKLTTEKFQMRKNNIKSSLNLKRKQLVANLRLNKVKNQEKAKIFKSKATRKMSSIRRDIYFKLRNLNKTIENLKVKTKRRIGSIKNQDKRNVHNFSKKIKNVIQSIKEESGMFFFKAKSSINDFIAPKRYKINKMLSKTKSKVKSKSKSLFFGISEKIEVAFFKAKYKSKIFIEDRKKQLAKLKTRLASKQNRKVFTKIALTALMLSLGIGGGMSAKKHIDDNSTKKSNNQTLEYEANNDIITDEQLLSSTLVNSSIQQNLIVDTTLLDINENNNELECDKIDDSELVICNDSEMEILDDLDIEQVDNSEIDMVEDADIEMVEDADIEIVETSEFGIGNVVNILDGSSLYSNIYDTYFDNNGLTPLYSNEKTPRTISSIIISNGDEIKNINNNEELSSYLDNNYQIIGCGVTNEYSQNGVIEGYYRLDSIKQNAHNNLQKTIR